MYICRRKEKELLFIKTKIMIRMSREYSIKCDGCFEQLEYPNDHVLTSYRGHVLTEGNAHHIEEVAKEYCWSIDSNMHLCPNCKKKLKTKN